MVKKQPKNMSNTLIIRIEKLDIKNDIALYTLRTLQCIAPQCKTITCKCLFAMHSLSYYITFVKE